MLLAAFQRIQLAQIPALAEAATDEARAGPWPGYTAWWLHTAKHWGFRRAKSPFLFQRIKHYKQGAKDCPSSLGVYYSFLSILL